MRYEHGIGFTDSPGNPGFRTYAEARENMHNCEKGVADWHSPPICSTKPPNHFLGRARQAGASCVVGGLRRQLLRARLTFCPFVTLISPPLSLSSSDTRHSSKAALKSGIHGTADESSDSVRLYRSSTARRRFDTEGCPASFRLRPAAFSSGPCRASYKAAQACTRGPHLLASTLQQTGGLMVRVRV